MRFISDFDSISIVAVAIAVAIVVVVVVVVVVIVVVVVKADRLFPRRTTSGKADSCSLILPETSS